MTIALALFAAGGMFLLTAGVGLFGGVRVRLPRLMGGVSLADEVARISSVEGAAGADARARESLIDRAIAPLARQLWDAAQQNERDWVERALDLLGAPAYLKTPADYYASKVLSAAVGFVAGAVADGGADFVELDVAEVQDAQELLV